MDGQKLRVRHAAECTGGVVLAEDLIVEGRPVSLSLKDGCTYAWKSRQFGDKLMPDEAYGLFEQKYAIMDEKAFTKAASGILITQLRRFWIWKQKCDDSSGLDRSRMARVENEHLSSLIKKTNRTMFHTVRWSLNNYVSELMT